MGFAITGEEEEEGWEDAPLAGVSQGSDWLIGFAITGGEGCWLGEGFQGSDWLIGFAITGGEG